MKLQEAARRKKRITSSRPRIKKKNLDKSAGKTFEQEKKVVSLLHSRKVTPAMRGSFPESYKKPPTEERESTGTKDSLAFRAEAGKGG